ncbi:alpha/beta hydrolase [Lapidilactobacillus mulanensis]|uniref:Alpha/beta hydrolase n=1 Tax=Lapidilactobacillus mulanensis TaxID=2485999 RepID=A0ABW4DSQ0_9LACO|nr:alpha/beta hydrolase [Lapidilactobacillus mulanensis]
MQIIEQQIKTKLSSSAKFYGYIPDVSQEIDPAAERPSVLICPGGGYVMTSDREAEPVALNFVAAGFNAFVLRYSIAPARYPVALLEVASAMKLIRKNSAAWHVDPKRVIIAGFSAGGHLAANFATSWDRDLVTEYGYHADEIQPNGLFLGYSVITSGKYAHVDSFKNLLGDRYGEPELMSKVSLEKQVTKSTPPAFIWHTVSDDTVPVENSLLFAEALEAHQISFELHLFPKGGHGLSLGTSATAIKSNGYGLEPTVSAWRDLFVAWVQNNI